MTSHTCSSPALTGLSWWCLSLLITKSKTRRRLHLKPSLTVRVRVATGESSRRRALRLDRQPSRVASFVGAVIASSVAALLLGTVLFAVLPHGTQFATSNNMPPSHGPGRPPGCSRGIRGCFLKPQAARTDSATQQLVRSPEFV